MSTNTWDAPTAGTEVTRLISLNPGPPGADAKAVQSAERQQASRRSTLVSVVVNIVLTAVQVITGLWAGSQALVADGLHSLSDLLSDFIVLLANRHSHKDADDDHQYGHRRFETGASLALGLLLTTVGAGMLWQAVLKLTGSEETAPVHQVALLVAGVTLVCKEGLFRYLLAVAQRVRSSMLVANAWHARSDAASSLVVALGIGGSLAGLPLLDPVAALVVGLMVGRMGLRFGWDALNDLMDRAASEEQIGEIRRVLEDTPGVLGVHGLRTRKMGDMIVVDAHLDVDERLSVKDGHAIAVLARERVMRDLPVLDLMTHLDPVDLSGQPGR
ncbi:MAG TPA: cation diffusion facilitator family transporter [Candidatus Aquabacterium excrementipullorum]|nr:cation diffusion facilitator family transporter [Candidatus Aquabacterium excrementipullorum]